MVGELEVRPFGRPARPASRWITGSFAVAITLLVAALLHPFARFGNNAPVARLRGIESRVSGGYAWAPLHRGITVASNIVLADARGRLTEKTLYNAALLSLLAGKPREAIQVLEENARATGDASSWTDLSSAYYETSIGHDAPELLANALAAADRALALDATQAEALFNRALVVERLGLRDDAREAWERYLTVDTTTGWAAEARSHLAILSPSRKFIELLDADYHRAGTDPGLAAELVRRDPRGARGSGLIDILGRWGDAVLAGDEPAAGHHLSVARNLGAEVAAIGDEMLRDAVVCIDGSAATRAALAHAHATYRDGMTLIQNGRPGLAEATLRRAAERFKAAGSPMSLPARHFLLTAIFDQGRHAEAEQECTALLAGISGRYPAYRAQLQWQLGSFLFSRADWGTAIELFEQSIAGFERLGEADGAAGARRNLAVIYDLIGDSKKAWTERIAALRDTGRTSNITVEKALASIADSAALRREWQTAASFLSLEIRVAGRIGRDAHVADALLLRAVVRDRLGDRRGAAIDLADAKAAAERCSDEAHRTYLRAAVLRATATLSGTSAGEAVALLTEAIAFQAAHSDLLSLPGLYLQRARARRASGDVDGALDDVRRGVAELERHRDSLPAGEARWGAFHATEELFEEGIGLSIDAGDDDAAFRFAEQARARALLDTYGRSHVVEYDRLPGGSVIVSYASLPERLVVFAVSRGGVRAATVEYAHWQLERDVTKLGRALRENKSAAFVTTAAALYDRLVAPIEVDLRDAGTVVFVPDAATATVAFSALLDRQGRYLIEHHAVVIAPSAAAYAAAAERRRDGGRPRTALVVSTSAPGADVGALAFVHAEARLVADVYGETQRLAEDQAELERLITGAPNADVIHFGGHAVGDDSGIDASSIVMRQDGRERRVGVAEIAKLRLRENATVVLAGCSTARGERRAAEGVISVAYGFLTAGASSVIATLWPIDDGHAAVFFPRIHRRLADGMSAADALRAEQLDAIARRSVPVSLWAAVQTIGS